MVRGQRIGPLPNKKRPRGSFSKKLLSEKTKDGCLNSGYNSKWTPRFHDHQYFLNSSPLSSNLGKGNIYKEIFFWTSNTLLKQEDE